MEMAVPLVFPLLMEICLLPFFDVASETLIIVLTVTESLDAILTEPVPCCWLKSCAVLIVRAEATGCLSLP